MVLWAIKERNSFLQTKVNNLKKQYQKQHIGIHNIRNSQKWKNRLDCTQNSCY